MWKFVLVAVASGLMIGAALAENEARDFNVGVMIRALAVCPGLELNSISKLTVPQIVETMDMNQSNAGAQEFNTLREEHGTTAACAHVRKSFPSFFIPE